MPAAGFGPESFLQSGRASFQTGSFCCAGQAKRTASPLTPALSPLRGEGARPAILEYRTLFPAFGQYVSERCPKAARPVEPPSASASTPSPLNGERAGVRGEDTGHLPSNKLSSASALCERQFFHCSRRGAV